MSGKIWRAFEVSTLRDAREAIEYGLMEAGALGTETRETNGTVSITGYFGGQPGKSEIRAALLDALRIYGAPAASLIDLRAHEVPDRDWLAEWKKDWQPVEVGRFIIAPPWIESEPPAVAGGPTRDRITIRINPGMAFGTGTHETTRLCLKAIEKHFRGGSFLDVGTGTGILAIAAARMFPQARIEGCDTDPEAIEIAKENAHLNDAAEHIAFSLGSVNERTASASLVCANLTAPVIVELLPSLLAATCGRLVLCGILDSQIELVQERLRDLGAEVLEIDQEGEWVAIVV